VDLNSNILKLQYIYSAYLWRSSVSVSNLARTALWTDQHCVCPCRIYNCRNLACCRRFPGKHQGRHTHWHLHYLLTVVSRPLYWTDREKKFIFPYQLVTELINLVKICMPENFSPRPKSCVLKITWLRCM
jgi:hypothetical protein